LLENYSKQSGQINLKVMQHLPKEDYDRMIGACDIGMIFLDHRFTIPNFPSRLLAYMSAKLPVLAVTDPNTDVGEVVVEGGFGWWVESNDTNSFLNRINQILIEDYRLMREKEFEYLVENFAPDKAYQTIIKTVELIKDET